MKTPYYFTLALGLLAGSQAPLFSQEQSQAQPPQAAAKVQNLPPDQFLRALEQSANPQLLDLRTFADYRYRHIPGAVNIEPGSPTFVMEVQDQLTQSDTLFLCCRIGKTQDVVKLLQSRIGYKVIYNLKGGTVALEAWQEKEKKAAAQAAKKGKKSAKK